MANQITHDWNFSNTFAPGATAVLSLPGSPGVVHVLTAMSCKFYTQATGGTGFFIHSIQVEQAQGFNPAVNLQVVGAVIVNLATVGSVDTADWSGKIYTDVGDSLIVTCTAVNPTQLGAFMSISGFDM